MDKFLKQFGIFCGVMAVLALALYTFKIIAYELLMVAVFGLVFIYFLLEIINTYKKKIKPLPSQYMKVISSGILCAAFIARMLR